MEKPHIVGQRSATVRQQRGSNAEGDRLGIVGIEPARCRLHCSTSAGEALEKVARSRVAGVLPTLCSALLGKGRRGSYGRTFAAIGLAGLRSSTMLITRSTFQAHEFG
jgi:hypothetical protein